MKIGVLAIQGGVIEHVKMLEALGQEAIEVRKKEDLGRLDGIILPGGESTAIGKLLRDRDILDALKQKIEEGLPAWGTCAGMILLAGKISDDTVKHIGTMDITVKRNAYGRQLGSFNTEGLVKEISNTPIPLVFIRAPFIESLGNGVTPLLSINGKIVAAKEKNMLVTSFHPELTDNLEFHKYFISMC